MNKKFRPYCALLLVIAMLCVLAAPAGALIEEPSEKPTVKPTVIPTVTPTPTPEPTVPPTVDTVDIKATFYESYDLSGRNIYYLSPEPIEYKIDDETITKEDLLAEKETISDKETVLTKTVLTKEEEDRLAILEKADSLREPYMDATVILEGYPDTEKLAFYSRTDEIKAAEKAAGIEYPYHMVWVDGAETLEGSITFPKDTYSNVYCLKEINGTIQVVDIPEYTGAEREITLPYYEIVDGSTIVYMDGFSGAGTEEDPWQVATETDLEHVGCGDTEGTYAGWDLDSYYIQTGDLTCTGSHTPIGSSGAPFVGEYDGAGYTITDLYIDLSTTDDVGLFGYLGDGAHLINIKVQDADITGQGYVGVIFGYANGALTVEQCSATGSVESTNGRTGVFGGYTYSGGTIQDCYASGSVTTGASSSYSADFIGYIRVTVTRCWSAGTVTSDSSSYKTAFAGRDTGTTTGNFVDSDVSNLGSATGATFKTTAEMQTLSTYTGASWDMVAEASYVDEVWALPTSAYPILGYEVEASGTAPVAAFSADDTSVEEDATVTFTDSSTNTPTSWSWDVDGDDTPDYTTQNPSHQYTSAGTFTVTLTATNAYGSDDEEKIDYITVSAATPPGEVTGLGETNTEITSITWGWTDPTDLDFDKCKVYLDSGSGYVYQGEIDEGIETWTKSGLDASTSYTVKITTIDDLGHESSGTTDSASTDPGIPPVAAFIADNTNPNTEQKVTFTDTSTDDPTSWAWDIDNDGDTDYTTQNCQHTYTVAGNYSVKLTVTNAYGNDNEIKIDYITVTEAPEPIPTITLRADMGETFIHWTWLPADEEVDVYLDGKPVKTNYTLGYYYLTDIEPNEEHRIMITNNTSGAQATSTIKTTAPHLIMLILLVLSGGFAMITYFIHPEIYTIICAVFTSLISSYGKTQAYGYLGMDLLFTGVIIFAGIWGLIAVISLGREYLAWN